VKLFSSRKTIKAKRCTTMIKDNIISLDNPEGKAEVLTNLLRSGARELIKKAVQTELTEFLSQYEDMTDLFNVSPKCTKRVKSLRGTFC
jgi:hypothetical protein